MNNNILLTAVAALLIGGIGGYTIANVNSPVPAGMHRMPDGSLMGNSSTDNTMGMMGEGMNHGMMMVASEQEFITEMIPHHQEAVDTAKQVLERGATTPEIKALVENIIAAQEKEIADMQSWHEAWYGTPYEPSGNYEPMMRDLTKLSGTEIDKVFLEDMIMHHMGALMMAHSVQGYIEHPELQDLTSNIIISQSNEIVQMRQLRSTLD